MQRCWKVKALRRKRPISNVSRNLNAIPARCNRLGISDRFLRMNGSGLSHAQLRLRHPDRLHSSLPFPSLFLGVLKIGRVELFGLQLGVCLSNSGARSHRKPLYQSQGGRARARPWPGEEGLQTRKPPPPLQPYPSNCIGSFYRFG